MTRYKQTIRLSIAIDLEMNDKIEATAEKIGISKAGAVRMMMFEYYKNQEGLEAFSKMDKIMKQLNTTEPIKK